MKVLAKFARIKNNGWYIAIRHRGDSLLYENTDSIFEIIPHPRRYWYADPFLFDDGDKTYLFAEEYDCIKRKGRISVAEIRNGKCGKFKPCLDLEHHLSYPCIYRKDGNIYLIPECYESGKIIRYKCEEFPYLWKMDSVLMDKAAADTTVFFNNGEEYFLSTIFEDKRKRVNDNLWLFNHDGNLKKVSSKQDSRCAGHVVAVKENFYIRPSQNCGTSYGGNLCFNTMIFDGNSYQETKLCDITHPDDIMKEKKRITLSKRPKETIFTGIHTYNVSRNYEVIDLKYTSHSFRSRFDFIINTILRKLGKRVLS